MNIENKSMNNDHINNNNNNHLINRINELIIKHSLNVPRLVSSHYLNYQFWSSLFTQLFHIKCDHTLRNKCEQLKAIRSCLNTIESLTNVSLSHVKPIRLLNYDLVTISNMIEIAWAWSEHFNDDFKNFVDDSELFSEDDDNNKENDNNKVKSNKSEPIIRRNDYNQQLIDESNDLAELLYEALKRQIIALEIEKRIKVYLGDITVSGDHFDHKLVRASRQSIVRTRSIQPVQIEKQSPILSVELERYFPEISSEIIERIQHLEQNLLVLEKNTQIQHIGHSHMNAILNYVVEKQKRHLQSVNNYYKNESLMKSHREYRQQRASISNEIREFSKLSMSRYLMVRSHLERILIEEFRKIDCHHREHLNEIRKYLQQNQDNLELDKIRDLLRINDDLL